MQFFIRSYPEQVFSYRVNDVYILNDQSLKVQFWRSKFWYFTILKQSFNKKLGIGDQTRNHHLKIVAHISGIDAWVHLSRNLYLHDILHTKIIILHEEGVYILQTVRDVSAQYDIRKW